MPANASLSVTAHSSCDSSRDRCLRLNHFHPAEPWSELLENGVHVDGALSDPSEVVDLTVAFDAPDPEYSQQLHQDLGGHALRTMLGGRGSQHEPYRSILSLVPLR